MIQQHRVCTLCLVVSYAGSYRVAFVANMLFVVKVESLLALGLLIQLSSSELQTSYVYISKCCNI